jgi:hypothetical protein
MFSKKEPSDGSMMTGPFFNKVAVSMQRHHGLLKTLALLNTLLAQPLPSTLSLFFSKLTQITLCAALIEAMACWIAKARRVGMAHK